ncbi:MAG: hypothetical protein JSV86_04880 [Gemmatimonadota bacterium]|nr:MAG: hypothetical protein JSV86_04880 [Gemmatimonadota bacterium]
MNKVSLNMETVQKVVNYLTHRPFVEVAELIQEIGKQVQSQLPKASEASEPEKQEAA